MLWVPEWTSTPGARRVFTCQVEPGRLQVGHNGNHAPLKYCQARERGSELVCLKFLWQHILMSVACCFMPYPSQNLVCLGKGGLKLHHKFRLNQFKHTFGKIKEYTYVFKNLQIPIICAVGEKHWKDKVSVIPPLHQTNFWKIRLIFGQKTERTNLYWNQSCVENINSISFSD